jgi:flagellar basal-body M-ring protein/flagellar hook-basal body protein (fliF)
MADWKEQSINLWRKLGKRQKYMIVGSAVLLFAAIIGWSLWWGGRPDNVPLFTEMDAKDAGEVAAKLKELKIPYEIGNNGTAILVSSKDVYRVRLELASQGLPRGNKGFEIFEQTKLGATEFQNKVYYLQALQGELTRTIEQMAEVEKARVHIVLPEDSLYKKNEKPATASIMVKLRPMKELSPEQVKGIVNLVAHSIQGLKPENITVVDNFARVLNDEPDSPQQKAGKATLTQMEMTKKVQDSLQKNVQTLLEQVMGPGKTAVRVSVELNFDQRTVDRQLFEPVVDDKGIVRSSQEVNETFRGTSNQPGGVPGTQTNIPGYVTNANGGQSQYEKKEATRNYEINETKEKTVVAPGAIRRLTVAVLVDANVNNTQRESIQNAVASAIGINTARGDMVSVETIPFSTELADRQRREEEDLAAAQTRAMWMKILAAVTAILAMIYVIRTIVRRRRMEEEEQLVEVPVESAAQPPHILEGVSNELTPEEQERMAQREAITKLAKSKPDEVAQLIKAWINED